jgi:hypothetical protein
MTKEQVEVEQIEQAAKRRRHEQHTGDHRRPLDKADQLYRLAEDLHTFIVEAKPALPEVDRKMELTRFRVPSGGSS